MRKKIKRPNGRGSVYMLSGNRRRPWAVAVTAGYDRNGKPIKEIIDYARSEDEGIVILHNYFDDPYDLEFKNITFEYIWNKTFKKLEKLVMDNKMSQKNIDALNNAFKNHLIPIHNDKILALKRNKIQNVIDNAKNKHDNSPLSYTSKGFMITVCKYVFESAIDDYELPIKRNPTDKLSAGDNINSNKHIPFTKEEESILWGLQHIDLVKIILIMNWTGLRPNEVFITQKSNIFIDLDYFVTGSKTKAGKNRPVPIHPKIKHLMKYFYSIDSEYPFQTIFNKYNYNKLSREYNKLMAELGMNHTPHDGRHTFITNMKKAGANDFILKRIVGHSIKDITEIVYTHRDIEELLNEVRRLK